MTVSIRRMTTSLFDRAEARLECESTCAEGLRKLARTSSSCPGARLGTKAIGFAKRKAVRRS